MSPSVATRDQQTLFNSSRANREVTQTSTFVDNMRLPIHGWFRYSAGFSAQWIESEIQKRLNAGGDVRVFDPFAGSGTTLIAAQTAGAESIGVDSHEFVSRVARAKLCWTEDASLVIDRAERVLAGVQPDFDPDPPPLLVKCFQPDALAALRGIRRSLLDLAADDEIDQLLWLALMAVLRPCSHVGTAQWQYVLPNKKKASVADPMVAFEAQVRRMVTNMTEVQSAVPNPPSARFIETDARECAGVPMGWANLVLTSPPYANNYDYADATRLEMTFLGEIGSWGDLKRIRKTLMRSCSQHMTGFDATGALGSPFLSPIIEELVPTVQDLTTVKAEHGGKKAYDQMIIAYFLDLAETWQSLRRVCAPGAEVCFVVGDSAPYGVHVPVERWLGELAVAAGFADWRFEKLRDRNVKWKNRKHRVPLKEGRLWVSG